MHVLSLVPVNLALQLFKGAKYDQSTNLAETHLPVVVWHGMGDSYNSESMHWVNETLNSYIPGLDVYSIALKEDGRGDQEASIVGDAMTQILQVCEQLHQESALNEGFNAIGFSQGGLFLRSAMELCGLPINNLITYGSPHNGVVDLPECDSWLCKQRNAFLKKHIYDDKIQDSIIQAQYFRDVYNYDEYMEKSAFLKYVNNELVVNRTYSENLQRLNKLVLVKFDRDKTLVPKESAWFYDIDTVTGDSIPFTQTENFEYDLIGIRKLYGEGRIDFKEVDGQHMEINEKDLKEIIGYL
ncbi:hypothetical protein FOA43_000066 [Brettanomyces nanus]|uniref:Palmitoyl-protein thioesterase 1 n=1 Tax=Eeniella nana TaxID=13502 RepID=A0A875RXN1_EENNA|nr:uncharacterized protein FOA43_000066 [Brettanomyces nanus]QPG72765.1 hypothetical protein FOA43_000066 [Brettanomyces nanus]